MRHHILVKWKQPPADQTALIRDVEQIFQDALQIPGIHRLEVLPNVVHHPNRYDLLIVLTMDPEALEVYDAGEAHHRWKDSYGDLIASKAIFDCD